MTALTEEQKTALRARVAALRAKWAQSPREPPPRVEWPRLTPDERAVVAHGMAWLDSLGP